MGRDTKAKNRTALDKLIRVEEKVIFAQCNTCSYRIKLLLTKYSCLSSFDSAFCSHGCFITIAYRSSCRHFYRRKIALSQRTPCERIWIQCSVSRILDGKGSWRSTSTSRGLSRKLVEFNWQTSRWIPQSR